jgi:hypothetical protein
MALIITATAARDQTMTAPVGKSKSAETVNPVTYPATPMK